MATKVNLCGVKNGFDGYCPICLNNFLYPIRLPCNHTFCFLCIKGASLRNRRCALCRQRIPREYFKSSPELTVSRLNTGTNWFYEGQNGWWLYDERANDEIECHYREGKPSMELLIVGHIYIIDFQEMVQYRIDQPRKRRKIRREHIDNIESKGIAGLIFDENRRISATPSVSSMQDVLKDTVGIIPSNSNLYENICNSDASGNVGVEEQNSSHSTDNDNMSIAFENGAVISNQNTKSTMIMMHTQNSPSINDEENSDAAIINQNSSSLISTSVPSHNSSISSGNIISVSVEGNVSSVNSVALHSPPIVSSHAGLCSSFVDPQPLLSTNGYDKKNIKTSPTSSVVSSNQILPPGNYTPSLSSSNEEYNFLYAEENCMSSCIPQYIPENDSSVRRKTCSHQTNFVNKGKNNMWYNYFNHIQNQQSRSGDEASAEVSSSTTNSSTPRTSESPPLFHAVSPTPFASSSRQLPSFSDNIVDPNNENATATSSSLFSLNGSTNKSIMVNKVFDGFTNNDNTYFVQSPLEIDRGKLPLRSAHCITACNDSITNSCNANSVSKTLDKKPQHYESATTSTNPFVVSIPRQKQEAFLCTPEMMPPPEYATEDDGSVDVEALSLPSLPPRYSDLECNSSASESQSELNVTENSGEDAQSQDNFAPLSHHIKHGYFHCESESNESNSSNFVSGHEDVLSFSHRKKYSSKNDSSSDNTNTSVLDSEFDSMLSLKTHEDVTSKSETSTSSHRSSEERITTSSSDMISESHTSDYSASDYY